MAYATADRQLILPLQAEQGISLQQAVERSGIGEHFPEIHDAAMKCGIFGKIKALDTVLEAGDRVEIYRPLQCDPKEMRRLRAAKNAVKRQSDSQD